MEQIQQTRNVERIQQTQQKLGNSVGQIQQKLENVEQTQEKILDEIRIGKQKQAVMLNDITELSSLLTSR